jgi:hypothetical protein
MFFLVIVITDYVSKLQTNEITCFYFLILHTTLFKRSEEGGILDHTFG